MEQIELIRHAAQTLDALAIPYALVGSWGSGIYGEPRFTRDIDIKKRIPKPGPTHRRPCGNSWNEFPVWYNLGER